MLLEIGYGNTRIYNFISVPQITLFLLEDAIISSKTNSCSGSTKQKIGSDGEVQKKKTNSPIFSFISTLYLTQQANILRCFCSLKFENILFSNRIFRCVFRSERKVYTTDIDQRKYFI